MLAVKDAVVYVTPSSDVRYEETVLPLVPAAVMATDSLLRDLTYAPILVATVVTVSSTVTEEMDGTTVAGTFSVIVHVRVPVSVPPL